MKYESVVNEPLLLTLQRATHATLQDLSAAVVDLDVTESEANALANLADGRGRTVSELGAGIGIRPTTLTGVLDRLERKGLITRGIRQGDRRAVLIELTPAGATAAAEVLRAMTELEARLLEGLSAGTIDETRRVLKALAGS
ncbi:MarR family winged helix-turn-helix transcriptional regulator [Nocardia sp. CDC160]|uniref:MarR family winged helix-turn-helix transcriptional regulator n=1 Tax=Nocardia sp. CDC160 TaxID=3112166 RepID=UPI002DBA68CF|nr:MarR family transcriptional regulator [Nocardia sp. CDC160]MEC3918100.1 MarR family transcriptional regulator [Nocardia sp. CDC160]